MKETMKDKPKKRPAIEILDEMDKIQRQFWSQDDEVHRLLLLKKKSHDLWAGAKVQWTKLHDRVQELRREYHGE